MTHNHSAITPCLGAEAVARQLGHGKQRREGAGWKTCCPAHDDDNPSLSVTDAADGSLLVFCHAGCAQDAVLAALADMGVAVRASSKRSSVRRSASNSNKKKHGAVPLLPIPREAPRFSPGVGRQHWTYHDASGRPLFHVARQDKPGGKSILPYLYAERPGGHREYVPMHHPFPRPLFNLEQLAAQPDAPVIVVEGEKKVAAAQARFPGFVGTCSSGGANSATKSDWSPLAGKDVIIWRDNDKAGETYARDVARLAHAVGAQVKIVTLPAGLPDGWDLADPLPNGVTDVDLLRGLETAAPCVPALEQAPTERKTSNGRPPSTEPEGRARPTEMMIELALAACSFCHNASRVPYAVVDRGGYIETWPIASPEFRLWLSSQLYRETGQAPTGAALDTVLDSLKARALFDSPVREVHLRVAKVGAGYVIDIGDDQRRVIKVDAAGWKLVASTDVLFHRPSSMRALPVPELGGSMEALRPFVNLGEKEFDMALAWMIEALRPDTHKPLLELSGPMGSAKSSTQARLRQLIDPNAADLRAPPRKSIELMVMATNSYMVSLENVSSLGAEMQDDLCRLSTGAGFGTRRLYANFDEALTCLMRPVMINGIAPNASRQDLIDRTVSLSVMPIKTYVSALSLDAEFAAARPKIFGAMLDLFAKALAVLPSVSIAPDKIPRMADFAAMGEAVFRSIGHAPETFVRHYDELKTEAAVRALDDSATAVCLQALLDDALEGIEVNFKQLLELLEKYASKGMKRLPDTPKALSGELTRLQTALTRVGIIVQRIEPRTSRGYVVRITRSADVHGAGSARSEAEQSDGPAMPPAS